MAGAAARGGAVAPTSDAAGVLLPQAAGAAAAHRLKAPTGAPMILEGRCC